MADAIIAFTTDFFNGSTMDSYILQGNTHALKEKQIIIPCHLKH